MKHIKKYIFQIQNTKHVPLKKPLPITIKYVNNLHKKARTKFCLFLFYSRANVTVTVTFISRDPMAKVSSETSIPSAAMA